MAIATLALVGLLLSVYLWLWKIGFLGGIACGTGSCETVQFSEYAVIFGMPVALFGVVGYLLILVVSLLGLQPRWLDRQGPTTLVTVLAGLGLAFTAYLTYLEAFVIEAWCRWCLVSAGIIALIFFAALAGLHAFRGATVHGDAVP